MFGSFGTFTPDMQIVTFVNHCTVWITSKLCRCDIYCLRRQGSMLTAKASLSQKSWCMWWLVIVASGNTDGVCSHVATSDAQIMQTAAIWLRIGR